MEKGLRKNEVIQELTKSTHGNLKSYLPTGKRAANEDPEFLAHLIAWNQIKGQVRDSKVALPVVQLMATESGLYSYAEDNALAHIELLDPRNLIKALDFAREAKGKHNYKSRALGKLVSRYLRKREAKWSWWEKVAVQHRESLKTLYARTHTKPNPMADRILFKNEKPRGSIFWTIANLKGMPAAEAAGYIIEKEIPFLILQGALGEKIQDEALALALISRMTPTELVTNTKLLEKLGIKTKPALKAAYQEALGKATTSKKATFKTTRAAEATSDEVLKKKLQGLQEQQLQNLGGVDGDWLVLGDKSGSMEQAIEVSRLVAGTLAKMVKGKVHLVFFDTSPRYLEVTGLSYEDIKKKTQMVTANGGTSIGVGLKYIMERGFEVDGIAIVSDSAENTVPLFPEEYKKYTAKSGREVPVYLYKTQGERTDALETNMARNGQDLQVFDLRSGLDYYSLPNVVQTMRTNRYSLVDEIMETPLLALE